MKNTACIEGLKAVFFNIGPRDCVLVSCSGQYLLIDGGAWYADSLRQYIRENKIQKLDYVVCTHAHEDHVDGLAEILADVDFGEVFCNIREFKESGGFSVFTDVVAQRGREIHVPEIGESIVLGNAIVQFMGPKDISRYEDINDHSLILKVSYGGRSILFMGDAHGTAAMDLMRRGFDLHADVIKVPHHGLSTLADGFLDVVAPQYAVISYGQNNYAPLSKELVQELESRGIDNYRTDLCGDIECCIFDDKVILKPRIDFETLIHKKLLILGANAESIPLVQKAREMGIYTIVTDHIPDSPAKKIADEALDIDGKDVDALAAYVMGKNIDGILLGVADPLVSYYCELCSRLGYPCIVDKKNTNYFINKALLHDLLAEYDIPTVKRYYIGSDFSEIKQGNIVFPVVAKPAIGRGGKGVSLCDCWEELRTAFQNAKRFSDNEEVIIEEFMDCEDVVASYLFCNGFPRLIFLSDRVVQRKKGEINAVTAGNYFPSLLTKYYCETMSRRMRSVFKKLKIRNGIMNIQMFVKDGKFYPYDPGCIINGELSGPICQEVFGVDIVRASIMYVLTGSMPPGLFNGTPVDRVCGASIWILLKPGIIGKIEGKDLLENNAYILGAIWRLGEGDEVTQEMYQTERSILARFWVQANSREELEKEVENIRNDIRVYDIEGNEIVVREVAI